MYRVASIDLLVRDLPPDRMDFSVGRRSPDGAAVAPQKRRARGILLVRMQIADARGRRSWGAAGDRPSFGWFDKRPEFSPEQKLTRLFGVAERAREIYLEHPEFESPFEQWRRRLPEVLEAGEAMRHEPLSAHFASSLMERAMIDAVCRLEGLSVFQALQQRRLGFHGERVFADLGDPPLHQLLPERPRTSFLIRHTVGLVDPLDAADLPSDARLNDGLPETLADYVREDGLRCFKIKISGDSERDLERLGKIWRVLQAAPAPLVTLDGNESYEDIDAFSAFVDALERRETGLFQHIAFIEQPLTRALTHDRSTASAIARISQRKPLVIDEADGSLNAFREARAIGYAGVSHKNCKGFFKSLLNYCLCGRLQRQDQLAFQSGEDLSTMPLTPLHQDFAALGVLGIEHCERNGHHYNWGLRHLTDGERRRAADRHADLYIGVGDQMRLRIRQGRVRCESLQTPGLGLAFEPDWESLTPLREWTPLW